MEIDWLTNLSTDSVDCQIFEKSISRQKFRQNWLTEKFSKKNRLNDIFSEKIDWLTNFFVWLTKYSKNRQNQWDNKFFEEIGFPKKPVDCQIFHENLFTD